MKAPLSQTHGISVHGDSEDTDNTLDLSRAPSFLVRSFISGAIPFRFIDNPDFKAFIHILCPNYDLCSRQTLRARYLPELATQLEAVMRKKMASIQHFSFTLDSWTSLGNQQFLAITAHGITEAWHLESFLLAMIHIDESETGKYIAQQVRLTMQRWGIAETAITALTTDSAANIKKAVIKHLHLPWVHCVAHGLNLAIINGILPSLPFPPQKCC